MYSLPTLCYNITVFCGGRYAPGSCGCSRGLKMLKDTDKKYRELYIVVYLVKDNEVRSSPGVY